MATLTTKTKVQLADGWELWIINSGPTSEVVLSFTEGTDGPVRERITIHVSQAKAVKIARALAAITFLPPARDPDTDEEDTEPGRKMPPDPDS